MTQPQTQSPALPRRIMSGMRPTGRLHLGNLLGALSNWVELQHEYECYFSVADWHALTTDYQETDGRSDIIRQMVIDWLSAGLDPERSTIYVQSSVKEHAELHVLLSMITPVAWLERVPTYKDQQQQLADRDLSTYGFLGYPLLQTADILAMQAGYVPVGEDQVPHLELAREVIRRFNFIYRTRLPEPQPLLNKYKLLPGVDGRKMSKSYGNSIGLAASEAEIKEKVQQMVTDPARIHKSDPGHPDVCVVAKFQQVFAEQGYSGLVEECRAGSIGCVACKKALIAALNDYLEPIRARRAKLEQQPELVDDVVAAGAERARRMAEETMGIVRRAMSL